MDNWDEKSIVFNIRLAKLTGLFQILDPGSIKFLGRNVYHIVGAIIVLYTFVVSMILIVSGLYYWADSIIVSVDYFWKGLTGLFLIYKMWNVVNHSNDLSDWLTITRYDFTSSGPRNRYILDVWRGRSVLITNMIGVTYLISLVVYTGSVLMFHDDILTVKNHDRSVESYRQNIINLYLLVTNETYNAHYETFYFIETLNIVCNSILFLTFDILLVTLCLAMSCQMQVINAAFASVGNKSNSHPRTPSIDNTGEKENISNEHDLIYDELISIIMDHQAVMKKYNEFLNIFKRSMLSQVFYSSISFIVIWFIFIMSFTSEDRFVASEVTTLKIFCTLPSISFQLLMACSLFDNLHKQKDSIILALYSSNWTEMNMKCKKLILLTMKMNNANQKKLTFTRTKIVNLELFYNIISNCYSVVWVLINYVKVKYE